MFPKNIAVLMQVSLKNKRIGSSPILSAVRGRLPFKITMVWVDTIDLSCRLQNQAGGRTTDDHQRCFTADLDRQIVCRPVMAEKTETSIAAQSRGH